MGNSACSFFVLDYVKDTKIGEKENETTMLVKGVGLLCLLLGALTIMNPKMWWEIMENWRRYKGEEPTAKWIRMTRISGWIYVLVGLAVIL